MLFSFIKKLTDAFYFYLMMSLMMMIFGKFKLNETHAHTHTHTHMHSYYTYMQLFLGSLLQISHMIDEVQLFYMHFSGTQSWQEFNGNYLKISISKLSPRRCSFRNVCFIHRHRHMHTCMYVHHTYTFICIFPNVCEVICGTANSCFKCRAAASGLLELNLLQLRERSQKQQAARRPTNSRPTRATHVTPSLSNT